MFSRTVTDYWLPDAVPGALTKAGEYRVITNGSLPGDFSLMILETSAGDRILTVTSAEARSLGLTSLSKVDDSELRSALAAAGVALHGADYLFYLPVDDQAAVRAETVPEQTRRLTTADAEAFAQFAAAAPAQDMDDAFVELDHWLVMGTFADGRLVAAASMYPWRGTRFADLGIITLPDHRGRGLAKRTVRAISARALADGYEPQYRCQLDNTPSVALARAAGFAPFGTWNVIAEAGSTAHMPPRDDHAGQPGHYG
jgi:RimJ/RimL family protein N-acetyltransferase